MVCATVLDAMYTFKPLWWSSAAVQMTLPLCHMPVLATLPITTWTLYHPTFSRERGVQTKTF